MSPCATGCNPGFDEILRSSLNLNLLLISNGSLHIDYQIFATMIQQQCEFLKNVSGCVQLWLWFKSSSYFLLSKAMWCSDGTSHYLTANNIHTCQRLVNLFVTQQLSTWEQLNILCRAVHKIFSFYCSLICLL